MSVRPSLDPRGIIKSKPQSEVHSNPGALRSGDTGLVKHFLALDGPEFDKEWPSERGVRDISPNKSRRHCSFSDVQAACICNPKRQSYVNHFLLGLVIFSKTLWRFSRAALEMTRATTRTSFLPSGSQVPSGPRSMRSSIPLSREAPAGGVNDPAVFEGLRLGGKDWAPLSDNSMFRVAMFGGSSCVVCTSKRVTLPPPLRYLRNRRKSTNQSSQSGCSGKSQTHLPMKSIPFTGSPCSVLVMCEVNSGVCYLSVFKDSELRKHH